MSLRPNTGRVVQVAPPHGSISQGCARQDDGRGVMTPPGNAGSSPAPASIFNGRVRRPGQSPRPAGPRATDLNDATRAQLRRRPDPASSCESCSGDSHTAAAPTLGRCAERARWRRGHLLPDAAPSRPLPSVTPYPCWRRTALPRALMAGGVASLLGARHRAFQSRQTDGGWWGTHLRACAWRATAGGPGRRSRAVRGAETKASGAAARAHGLVHPATPRPVRSSNHLGLLIAAQASTSSSSRRSRRGEVSHSVTGARR